MGRNVRLLTKGSGGAARLVSLMADAPHPEGCGEEVELGLG